MTDKAAHLELQGWLKEREEYSTFLKQHLTRAQAKIKNDADKNRTPREFSVGDSVFLKLQPYAQHTVVNRPCRKLAMKFFGPFVILQRIWFSSIQTAAPGEQSGTSRVPCLSVEETRPRLYSSVQFPARTTPFGHC